MTSLQMGRWGHGMGILCRQAGMRLGVHVGGGGLEAHHHPVIPCVETMGCIGYVPCIIYLNPLKTLWGKFDVLQTFPGSLINAQ